MALLLPTRQRAHGATARALLRSSKQLPEMLVQRARTP
jgi:hypothetical protein